MYIVFFLLLYLCFCYFKLWSLFCKKSKVSPLPAVHVYLSVQSVLLQARCYIFALWSFVGFENSSNSRRKLPTFPNPSCLLECAVFAGPPQTELLCFQPPVPTFLGRGTKLKKMGIFWYCLCQYCTDTRTRATEDVARHFGFFMISLQSRLGPRLPSIGAAYFTVASSR